MLYSGAIVTDPNKCLQIVGGNSRVIAGGDSAPTGTCGELADRGGTRPVVLESTEAFVKPSQVVIWGLSTR